MKFLIYEKNNKKTISWSTITQFVHQYIGILNTLSEEHNQEKMYSDYSKAFNKLNHSTLLLQAF